MPASRAARMTRTAISPRFAMRTLVMRGIPPAYWPTQVRLWARFTKRRSSCLGTPQRRAGAGCRRRPPSPQVPQLGPLDAELAHELAERREGEPDDRRRIARDRADERSAEAVDGERPRHGERLARGHVGLDLHRCEFG